MRIGTVCYATDQGLGILAKDWYDHHIITDVLLFRHGARKNHPEWYPPDTKMLVDRPFNGPDVDRFVRSVDAMVFFETPFDWDFPAYCRERGVRTVMVPMYEWFPDSQKHKDLFDKFICPSALDERYFPGNPVIPPPVDPTKWNLRRFARRFLHNAGNIGHRWHKGTEQIIQAVPHLDDHVDLTIRAQDTSEFRKILRKNSDVDLSKVKVELGNRDYATLFTGFDVYVAPEKFNGLSLPLQEAANHGLAVMASDRFPVTTWLPRRCLIPVERYHEACIGRSYHKFWEAEVRPEEIARCMNELAGQDITDLSVANLLWSEENSWRVVGPRLIKEILS